MDLIAGIFESLGVNSTLWIQMGIFFVSYIALTQLIFKPYLAAYNERANRTLGNEEFADRMVAEADDLNSEFETKARKMNFQFKAIYDQTRTEAMREHDRLVSQAKEDANALLEKTRLHISDKLIEEEKRLDNEIPKIRQQVVAKVLGKELN